MLAAALRRAVSMHRAGRLPRSAEHDDNRFFWLEPCVRLCRPRVGGALSHQSRARSALSPIRPNPQRQKSYLGSPFRFRCSRQNATFHSIGVRLGNRQREAKMATYSIGDLGRREILKMSAVLAGSGALFSTKVAAAEAALPRTPGQILGPFY